MLLTLAFDDSILTSFTSSSLSTTFSKLNFLNSLLVVTLLPLPDVPLQLHHFTLCAPSKTDYRVCALVRVRVVS